ncbi:hypothetical protein M0R45_026150 [Rubus argutus]|uniref:Uncharacterized protein n=1 Tax=Rubus argutus TaxID=59490 RepID=A0AAW1X0A1_RUBAR
MVSQINKAAQNKANERKQLRAAQERKKKIKNCTEKNENNPATNLASLFCRYSPPALTAPQAERERKVAQPPCRRQAPISSEIPHSPRCHRSQQATAPPLSRVPVLPLIAATDLFPKTASHLPMPSTATISNLPLSPCSLSKIEKPKGAEKENEKLQAKKKINEIGRREESPARQTSRRRRRCPNFQATPKSLPHCYRAPKPRSHRTRAALPVNAITAALCVSIQPRANLRHRQSLASAAKEEKMRAQEENEGKGRTD